jgi:hypothetical protein
LRREPQIDNIEYVKKLVVELEFSHLGAVTGRFLSKGHGDGS